jgi:3D (Asp-Asp-Asp) domain-containing protein
LRRSQALPVSSAALALGGALILSGCGTTGTRPLPQYEAPVAKARFQTVRTTAYTHTEADHREFSNRNALGGELQAAGWPIHRAGNTTTRNLTLAAEEQSDYRVASYTGGLQPFQMEDEKPVRKARRVSSAAPPRTHRVVRIVRGKRVVVTRKLPPPKIGSAAADWSRWPVGTTFRLLSTGQTYRVDDYGWALAGRNTIDLYMATPREMNDWGTRTEPIEILRWGDPQESLRLLAPHEAHKHIRRMVLELQGNEERAAQLQ